MSQNDILLDAMRRGERITPLRAFILCGSLACHSRMAELRRRGHDIACVVKQERGRKFGEYWLVK